MLANHEEMNGTSRAVTTVTVTHGSSPGSVPRHNVTIIRNTSLPPSPTPSGDNITVIQNNASNTRHLGIVALTPRDEEDGTPLDGSPTVVHNNVVTIKHNLHTPPHPEPEPPATKPASATVFSNSIVCNGVHSSNGQDRDEWKEDKDNEENEEEEDDFLAPLPAQTRRMRPRSLDPPLPFPQGVAEGSELPKDSSKEPPKVPLKEIPSPLTYPPPVPCQLPAEFREHFHINLSLTNGSEEAGVQDSATFAGRRDVTDPRNLQEREIVSSRGTVRGFKNRVRAGIATFVESPTTDKLRSYRVAEKGKIVIYTTSMTVVRDVYEKCKLVKKILQNHMVRYDERDLYMSRENQRELRERLGDEQVKVPQIFADGIHLGSASELEALNETGDLRDVLKNFPRIQVRTMCLKCGGYRYVPCSVCHGSKKSVHRNHFTEEFCALRCMQCDENGLQRCDLCLDQQE